VGTLLDAPCATEKSRAKNFTNLGGVGGRICYLKNVNAMWLVRQCLEHWESPGHPYDLNRLIGECESLPAPDHLLDVDDPDLLLQGDMPGKINAQRRRAGHAPFREDGAGIPAIANAIFHSLAARYAEVLNDIGAITGKKINRIYIAGGGNKNMLVNRLTAERAGLQVILASAESTTLGNFAVQLAALENSPDKDGVTHSSVAKWAKIFAERPGLLTADAVAR
jgi:rhamnulokinase